MVKPRPSPLALARAFAANVDFQPQAALPVRAPDWRDPLRLDPEVLEAKLADNRPLEGDHRLHRLRRLLDDVIPGGLVIADIWDPDLDALFQRGAIMTSPVAVFPGPMPDHCHWNSAFLAWANRECLRLASGYALSPNGLWVSHSWVTVSQHEVRGCSPDTGVTGIVETTTPRLAYFGIEIDRVETALRWDSIRSEEFLPEELAARGFAPSDIEEIIEGTRWSREADDPSVEP